MASPRGTLLVFAGKTKPAQQPTAFWRRDLLQSKPSAATIGRRSFLAVAGAGLVGAAASKPALADSATASDQTPPFVRRGLPGPFHQVLEPLVGTWAVDKQIFIAAGTPKSPALSRDMTCRRKWFGGGKHLEDVTEGSLAGGAYYRMGVLGFSTMDSRYEWATFDALNANAMLYVSAPLKAPSSKIELTGAFTDQGLLGERYAGKSVAMRTMIDIQSPERHVIDLFFKPHGETERLIDRSVYARA